jgi:hypothetical protein
LNCSIAVILGRENDCIQEIDSSIFRLDDLITHLLPSEIRFLQKRLENDFVRDFVPELPVEITILMSQYLTPYDLLTTHLVSKRWRETWTNVSICNKLMKEYFRSTFETSYSELPRDSRSTTFVTALRQMCAMQSGDYNSMRILRYDRGKDNGPQPVLDREYCNGRVAWSIKGGIQVRTLCTDVTMLYMTPNRDDVVKWTLSERFVVAVTGSSSSGR